MTLIVRRADTSTGSVSPQAGAVGEAAQEVYQQLTEALKGLRDPFSFSMRVIHKN